MSRFDLTLLPRCGAKTRSGEPCKRYGTLHNGRCKLHGGRSTGAKTQAGKLAVRTNAVKNSFNWFFRQQLDEPLLNAGYRVLEELTQLAEATDSHKRLMALLAEDHAALEYSKHYILAMSGYEAFALAQCALDHFYRHVDAGHLRFQRYVAMPPQILFHKPYSQAQLQTQIAWDARALSKQPQIWDGFPAAPNWPTR